MSVKLLRVYVKEEHLRIIKKVAKDNFEGNLSMSLRYIVRKYGEESSKKETGEKGRQHLNIEQK